MTKPARKRLADALAAVCSDANTHWYASGGAEVSLGADRAWFYIPSDGYENSKSWSVSYATDDPAEAWEMMATREVIPLEWVQDRTRSFQCGHCVDGYVRAAVPPYGTTMVGQCGRCNGKGHCHHPPSVAACVLFAADVPGILTAERLARDIILKLQSWGSSVSERSLWQLHSKSVEEVHAARPIAATHPQNTVALYQAIFDLGYMFDRVKPDHLVLLAPQL